MPIIQSKSQLINYFNQGTKKEDKLLIGVEHEKFLFSGKEKKRVNYEQIKKIFKNLEAFGWKPIYEKENIVGLKRDKQQITTEPGLQYELSGAPLKNIHLVCSESSTHFNEIKSASKGLDINTASIGFDPFNN
jgi:glutamate--cysteine ligase